MTEEGLFYRKASGLVRQVGLLPTIAIAFAFTVPGIFFLPFEATYYYVGCNAPLAWGLASFMMFWGSIALVFLAVAMPRTAADYVGLTRALNPLLGFLASWINGIALMMLVGVVSYFGVMLFGNFFTIAGALTNNPYYINIGQMLTKPAIILEVSIIMIVIAMVINFLGATIYRYIMDILLIIPLIAMIIGLIAAIWFSLLGPTAVQSAWDSVFGVGAWKEIETVAIKNGWENYVSSATGSSGVFGFPGKWIWAATSAAIIPAAFSCWGYESAIYVSGEIKEARKNISWGFIIAYILLTFFYVSMVYFIHINYGKFLSMYSYIVENGYTNQLTVNTPTYPGWDIFGSVLATALFGPTIGAFAAIPGGWTNLLWSIIGILLTSRILFAWSFDRIFPKFLSNVNDRFRSPHWSILVAGVVGIIGAAYTIYHPYFAMISMFNGASVRYLFAAWAALLLPFMRPSIFKMGFTWKIGKIPVVAIIGGIATITTSWLFIVSIAILSGDWLSIYWQIIALFSGVIVFAIYYAYNKSKGIDIDAMWREIPPL